LVKDLADFSRRDRPPYTASSTTGPPKARDRWLGIAEGEQDFEVWLCGKRRLRQFNAIHAAGITTSVKIIAILG
jgi:hypothetical protein